MKIKFCEAGNHEVEKLWHSKRKDRPSCCQSCLKREPIRNDKVKVDTKVTEGKKVSVRSANKTIRKVSDKQAKINKAYTILREQFLKDKPFCGIEFQNCTRIATDIHHKGIGSNKRKFYNDTSTWIQTCRHCHNTAHDLSAVEQYALGLRIKT